MYFASVLVQHYPSQKPEYSRAVPGQRYYRSVEYYEACTQGRKLRSVLPLLLEQTYSTGPSLSDTFDYCKQFSRVGKTRRKLVGGANTRIIATTPTSAETSEMRTPSNTHTHTRTSFFAALRNYSLSRASRCNLPVRKNKYLVIGHRMAKRCIIAKCTGRKK